MSRQSPLMWSICKVSASPSQKPELAQRSQTYGTPVSSSALRSRS
ncbi:hypothetical protein [Streptomyces winkii]|nr:hypothetical protein [Streptomyces sp. DSM 40971]